MRQILFICVLAVVSCKPDKSPDILITSSDITGDWEIYHATRNGKETKSLESGNFVFQADNTLKSNILNAENSYTFTIENNIIQIEGAELLKELTILDLKQDTLALGAKMKVFDLEFFLARK